MSYQRLSEISADLIDEAEAYPFVRAKLFKAMEPPKQNVVILKGARGIGKSTLLKQFLWKCRSQHNQVFYFSADSSLLETRLVELAHEYYKRGGVYLAMDEIHKYPGWQTEIKTIIDSFTSLKLIISGSSSLHLDYAKADLSRRHVMLNAQGLSFREYIEKNYKLEFNSYNLKEVLNQSEEMTRAIVNVFRRNNLDLIREFKSYLKTGYFLSKENYSTDNLYYDSLLNTINSVIDGDLPYIHKEIDNLSLQKIKFLMKHIANKCPFTPNISQLSKHLGIANDNTLKKYLYYLSEGEVLINLYSANKSYKDFQRPQKIFLNNTNFSYAYTNNPSLGTIRETFVTNCLKNQGSLSAPTFGDFYLDDEWLFEVGGKSKNKRQIKSIKSSYVLADDILTAEKEKIPLWLLGFLW